MNLSMLQKIALAELYACAVAWFLPFFKARRRAAGQKKVVRATASRWGIVLQSIGSLLIYPVGATKSVPSLVISMLLGPLSVALGWAAVRHLGKQWRFEAALSEDHELIQTGPYRWIRHPIYASMLCLFLEVGSAWTWWPMLAAGLIVFLAGTEIRVRAEDRLLAERFGDRFSAYHSRVHAYIPFVR